MIISHLSFEDSGNGLLKINDKILHLTEYYFLGILLFRYLSKVKGLKNGRSYLITLLYGTAFAVSDEIHQGFIGYFDSGVFGGVRNPDIMDILADMTGICLSLLTIFVLDLFKQLNLTRD